MYGSSLQGPAPHHDQSSAAAGDARRRVFTRGAAVLIRLISRDLSSVRKNEQQRSHDGPVQPVCGALPAGEDPREGADR